MAIEVFVHLRAVQPSISRGAGHCAVAGRNMIVSAAGGRCALQGGAGA